VIGFDKRKWWRTKGALVFFANNELRQVTLGTGTPLCKQKSPLTTSATPPSERIILEIPSRR
jgi:hypothetical protein